MTLHAIASPFVDTCAADLRLGLGLAPVEPLATCFVAGADLRVLGASHQVVIETEDEPFTETIAYLPHVPMPLPERHTAPGYSLRTSVTHLAPDALRDAVNAFVPALGERDDAVVARFPGNDLALTALVAERRDDVLTWRTWHVYPQHGELVETASSLDLLRRRDPA